MTSTSRSDLKLSIVIAAWNGVAALEHCLHSLNGDDRSPDTEVLAVTNFDGGTRAMLAEHFPDVQHIPLASDTTVPVLRSAGIHGAGGEIVALTEDHCTFGKDWCREVKRAHELPYPAIGGAVENASVRRALDWAVYFYDYGKFMLPGRAGAVTALPGNNVSYKRQILEEVESSFRNGFFEPFTNSEIVKHGHVLYWTPSAIVYNQKNHELKDAVTKCYHLARGYAARRIANAPRLKRAGFVVGSLVLPLILTGRIVVQTARKSRHLRALLGSTPYLILLMTSWSCGEFCGYLAGEGRSAGKWK